MSAGGKFREQITVYAPTEQMSDGAGGFIAVPLPFAGSRLGISTFPFVLASAGAVEATTLTCWARVEQLAAKEDLVNGKISYRQPYRFTLRAGQAELTNAMRIEWRGLHISIVSVKQDERSTEITLLGYANR